MKQRSLRHRASEDPDTACIDQIDRMPSAPEQRRANSLRCWSYSLLIVALIFCHCSGSQVQHVEEAKQFRFLIDQALSVVKCSCRTVGTAGGWDCLQIQQQIPSCQSLPSSDRAPENWHHKEEERERQDPVHNLHREECLQCQIQHDTAWQKWPYIAATEFLIHSP